MLTTGSVLQDRYEIEQLLGQGGFGAVYRARDNRLMQSVAIKETFDHAPGAEHQFEFEARLLASLRHPALPAVSDHFVEQSAQYLVMEYVPGESLSAYLARQPERRLSEPEALRIIAPLLDALEYMHSHAPPIIHRDIKPDNIRISPEGAVYLVDFGLAKAYDPATKTTIGARAVTPGFSPLEQYGAGSTDACSDLYALGATLYTMLGGTEVPEAPQRALQDTLQPLRQVNPMVSPHMEAITMRLLAMRPEDRYPHVTALRQDLLSLPGRYGTPTPSTPDNGHAPVTTALQPALETIPLASPVSLEYANLWQRLAAAVIDGALVLLSSLVLGELLGLMLRFYAGPLAVLVGIIFVWLYYPLMESSPTQATLGKMVFGIFVTDLNGNRISYPTALVRTMYKLLTALALPFLGFFLRLLRRPDVLVLFLALLPFAAAAFSAQRQALHDRLTGCVVVQRRWGDTVTG